MKKVLSIITSVILASWHTPLAAQKVVPLVGMDYNVNDGWGAQSLNQLNVHIGFVYDRVLFVEMHEGFNNLVRSAEFRQFHYLSSSFSGTVRFAPRFKLSPTLSLTGGFGYPYASDSAFIDGNSLRANPHNALYNHGIFKKVSGFGSAQVGADLLLERWHFQISGGITSLRMQVQRWSGSTRIIKHVGWIASVGVSYELRFGKQ